MFGELHSVIYHSNTLPLTLMSSWKEKILLIQRERRINFCKRIAMKMRSMVMTPLGTEAIHHQAQFLMYIPPQRVLTSLNLELFYDFKMVCCFPSANANFAINCTLISAIFLGNIRWKNAEINYRRPARMILIIDLSGMSGSFDEEFPSRYS